MYKILLHVGLPKTATTTLQCNVLYPLHAQGRINFLGRYLEPRDDEFYNPIGGIISQLDEEKTNVQIRDLQMALYDLLDSSQLNVISEECISLTHKEKHNIRFRNLSRLFEECEVTVLISLRNPVDFIFSYYVEMYKWYYHSVKDSNTFEKFVQRVIESPEKSEFDILFFDRLIHQFSCYFPTIDILLFEDIKCNSEDYFERLSKVISAKGFELGAMFEKNVKNSREVKGILKFSERDTLIDRLDKLKRKNGLTSYLRKNLLVRKAGKKIIEKFGTVRLGHSKGHKELAPPAREEIKACLLKDKATVLNSYDRGVLIKHGYLCEGVR